MKLFLCQLDVNSFIYFIPSFNAFSLNLSFILVFLFFSKLGKRKHDYAVTIERDPDSANVGMLSKDVKPNGPKQPNREHFPIRNPHAYNSRDKSTKTSPAYSKAKNGKRLL